MPRQKGVKFQHRANSNGNSDNRRHNSSTTSESSSEPPSPTRDVDSTRNGSADKTEKPAEQSDYEKKKATFITRTIWTLAMIAGFFGAMFAGHIYIIMIITAVQIISFKEVIAIAQVPTKQKNLPLTKSLSWYFLAMSMYFVYGESVIYYFKHILLVDKVLLPFATHHRFISFIMYMFGKSFNCPSMQPVIDSFPQVSSSLLLPSRKATIGSSLLSLPGRIWLST